ncbi:DUF2207 domain-containing protein [Mycolicibacterium frederiksbergense]|uniref:DUF2207 domain-containing protein n=1 Tax=Mycolicibacterium frederiksbergense TaxID=117567 RepID=UPI00265C6684|nr:DUF2207 domain-containing protein [Mycolicibacterium frederiksbergense]MDO0976973.1 DUF2207 domain-containing protein [Mycolicibacterium frederiksbergense]
MGRLFKLLIPLVLIAFGVLWPVVFSATPTGGGDASSDPVVISDYTAHYTVDADGDLDAVETITGEFPLNRHGIFRHWDVANQNSPKVRQVPQIQSILWDGEPAPYQLLWEGRDRFRVAKIGSPDSTLSPGPHVFKIRYRIPGVLDPGTAGAGEQFGGSTGETSAPTVFFWNVVAPAWNNRIQNVDITVTLPEPVVGAQCSVGYGRGYACSDLTVEGATVRLGAQGLAPHTPVTLRAGMDIPTPPRAELLWTYHWDRVLGQSTTRVVVLLGLALLAGLAAILWSRSTVEAPPGFPIQYAPPPGLGPVQTEYIRTEAVPKNGLTATLFHLAERQLVDLRQISKNDWNVTGTAAPGAWADIDPVGVAVGSALKIIGPGAEFKARKSARSGEKLSKAKTDMADAVQQWALGEGLMVRRRKELWLRAANAVAAILMVCGFFRWGFPITLWALPFAVFFLFSAASWRAGVGTRRTAAGRELWSRAGGFHRLLSTDSAESRFDFGARKDLYAAYVPFAVAAGSAALWAQKYRDVTGAVAPQPEWYHSSSSTSWGLSGGSGGGGFDSFESALSSSIGAYTASQSSSSSGGSSSGGGGGGGGGGGSW